ncbi:Mediator of rna polymerase ii transcription subunit [Thalictrum thalictroides]|uniref:Mediator of RNA polymerase II transcription subunit 4 n=1 Tax=Thalictrum thalictroides TaxID=46969 RepID=A0A7J6WPW6_THATH|nr:Mediator of rna polymerase ii transcription subunit [Thalictrum thalictroides]
MLQSQILQSPARLGLTPNSPSLSSNPTTPNLSSQNPQLHYSHQQHQQQQSPLPTALTTTTTSSTLLSLLPPLSRAQSLLLQMASLAAKLFEVSPNRSLWLASFRGSLPTFLSSQIQNLNPPPLDSSPSSPKEILSIFTSLQTQLFEAVAELQEILDLQDAKQKIAREIRAKDSVLLTFANKIKEAEHVLDVLVDDYSDYRCSKRLKSEVVVDPMDDNGTMDNSDSNSSNTSVGTTLSLSDILSYAHRISYTTFAPPEFGAGQGPLRGALPPAPQEEQMRASQLYAFADLDVGLPKVVEADERTIDSLVEPSAMQPNENVDFAAVQGLVPPPGWKIGMPVELQGLPSDLPPPPPGWKIGDPIPLPPTGAFAPKADELPPRPVAHMPLKAPEPIQVRFVQLDINPDQDDDSSDYTTGESSEEDEE